MTPEQNIWIGTAEVKPMPGNDMLAPGARGAFVSAVGIGSDLDEFAVKVRRLLALLSFDVLEVTDIELLADRQKRDKVERRLLKQVSGLTLADPVGLGTFDSYNEE